MGTFDEEEFPQGLRLLGRWQAGDAEAKDRLKELFRLAITGDFDPVFATPVNGDEIQVSGSIDLLSLGLVFDLFGTTAAEFYKADPERYVRCVMLTLRLLGMPKTYLSWPVYGFTAEALGQEMIYSDRFSPGTDPEVALIDSTNWRNLKPLVTDSGIPEIVAETLRAYRRITGHRPVLHLSAPYSLAADIYGQEFLINDLTHGPEMVNEMLDHLADTVHRPWIDSFFAEHPDGWCELSDASGSPFFIGPQNCRDVAIRSVQRLRDASPWGNQIYVANYRGDYVSQARKRENTKRRRPAAKATETMNLDALFAAKNSVCPDYVIRLADDRVASSFYVAKAIEARVPLFMGVGATEIDRNSVGDLELARIETEAVAADKVKAVRTVAEAILKAGYQPEGPPWPGCVYFEDVSAESSFELVEIIVGAALSAGHREPN